MKRSFDQIEDMKSQVPDVEIISSASLKVKKKKNSSSVELDQIFNTAAVDLFIDEKECKLHFGFNNYGFRSYVNMHFPVSEILKQFKKNTDAYASPGNIIIDLAYIQTALFMFRDEPLENPIQLSVHAVKGLEVCIRNNPDYKGQRIISFRNGELSIDWDFNKQFEEINWMLSEMIIFMLKYRKVKLNIPESLLRCYKELFRLIKNWPK